MNKSSQGVVIIGGGPAGLTAAFKLINSGAQATVLEKDTVVGGISRTARYKGYLFDIGGHRFFTKAPAVQKMWEEVLPRADFLVRPRLSRIYYNNTFFHYPLKPLNALLGLGIWNSTLILASYVWAHLFPSLPEDNFEQWVSNRFGRRLYKTFFKTYTEKVWGVPGHTISADWAAQRIRGLSLLVALKNALLKRDEIKSEIVKTLVDSFEYPRRGPGMMWEAVAQLVTTKGGTIHLATEVSAVRWVDGKVRLVEVAMGPRKEAVEGDHFISSMPIRELIHKFDPPVPQPVLDAANRLKYRDFLTVALIVSRRDLFPDNWIYIHDPKVKIGRIQNFKNWSPDMVPDPETTCLGLEYFCFEGDGLWMMDDAALIELGKRELALTGLVDPKEVTDGTVVRMPKAYPIYDAQYREALDVIKEFLSHVSNLQVVGRNGMHRYNNQDHSMLTAMLAVENILGAHHDLWAVNADQEYHEESSADETDLTAQARVLAATQPFVPQPARLTAGQRSLVLAFGKLDKLAFATAVGTVAGLATLGVTLGLILKGGTDVGQTPQLLAQFFPGFSVTVGGALLGAGYGFVIVFLWGWFFAYVRNFALGLILYRVKREAELFSFRQFLDHF